MALTFVDTHNMITYLTKLDASEESIDYLPNEEIFAELARMGYENPSIKLTFYKAFFSDQWKFLIHTIVQCMSAKRTSWNEFSSSMASAIFQVLYLSMIPTVDDSCLSWVGKGFSGVDTPLFEGMLVPQQAADDVADNIVADDVATDVVAEDVAEPTPPPPTPATTPPPPQQEEDASKRGGGIIAELDADEDITLEEVDATKDAEVDAVKDDKVAEKDADVLSMHDDEPELTELKEVIEVVTTAKLMTEVVTFPATTAASTITAAPSAARRRKGAVIRDPKETATPSTIKDEAYARELEAKLNKNINWDDVIEQMDFFRGMSYDDIKLIFEKYFNSNVAFLEKSEKELKEEASMALKRKSKSSEEKAVKKQKLDEEVKELKKHLKIVPNDEDDVYTEVTPLALKVTVVDYQIHTEHNKPYYKIIRADGTHQLFLSFISLLRNFDREDLEMLWHIVQERFASSKTKNFSDDFLLNTLKAVFEKPDVKAHIWKNQRGNYGLAKVKSWKLLESCGVHIITFTTTQMILLVERRYPLTRFTLDQTLNNVRLEVEEESKVSLKLLRFTSKNIHKLKLLDTAANSRLRLLEESAAANDKMKK
nr:hypothetical protein [Tanacetum cinerariifolium]